MLLKPFAQFITEIKLNTAVRAYRKMDDIANDWEASKEDTKRANRFRNRIKSKFGEKGAALADKISSPESKAIRDKRETNRYGHDSLKHRVLNPLNKTPLKSGPRKGKLTKPTQDLLKAQSVYQRKDINKVKPNLPESFKLSFAQFITENTAHKVKHKGRVIGSLYQLPNKVVGYHDDSGAQFDAKSIEHGTEKMKRAHKSWQSYEKSNLKEAKDEPKSLMFSAHDKGRRCSECGKAKGLKHKADCSKRKKYVKEERDQDKDGHAISDAWIKKYGHRGQTSLGHEAILPPGKFFASLITKARLVWPDNTFRYGHPSQTNSYEFRTHPTKPGLVAVVGHVWWANHWPSGWYTRAAAAELYKALKADGMVEDKT